MRLALEELVEEFLRRFRLDFLAGLLDGLEDSSSVDEGALNMFIERVVFFKNEQVLLNINGTSLISVK